jgi:hypothetical protein
MGYVIFLKFFNSNSHSHSYNFFFGIAIPIPILFHELGFHESTTELGQLLISENFHPPEANLSVFFSADRNYANNMVPNS